MSSLHSPTRIVAVALLCFAAATGPAVGLLDVPDPAPAALGTGDASVEVVSVPETARLEAGTYTDVHELLVPPVVADVSALSGAPTLTASVDLPRLGFTRSSVYILRSTGRQTVRVRPTTFDAERIRNDSYPGRLRVVLRDGAGERVLVDRPIRVEVVE